MKNLIRLWKHTVMMLVLALTLNQLFGQGVIYDVVPSAYTWETQRYYKHNKVYGSFTHLGTDINAPVGSEVCSMADGIVVEVWNDGVHSGMGNGIRIKHPGCGKNGQDIYTLYLHLQTQDKPTTLFIIGDKVSKGQKIGRIGDTGSGIVHLHFEIRYFTTLCHPQYGRIHIPGDITASEIAQNDWENAETYKSYSTINSGVDIFAGTVSTPKKVKVWFVQKDAGDNYSVGELKIGNVSIDNTAITKKPSEPITGKCTFEINLTSGLLTGLTNQSYDFSFTINGNKRYFGAKQIYFLDPSSFTDVKIDEWYKGFVYWGAQSGIFKGSSPVTFGVESNLKRGQMAKVIVSAAVNLGLYDIDVTTTKNGTFSDCLPGNAYFPYVQTLRNREYVMVDSKFEPNSEITAAQFAKILCNGLMISDADINQHTLYNSKGLLGSKVLIQTKDATLQVYLDRISKIVSIFRNEKGKEFVLNLCSGLAPITHTTVTGNQFLVNGDNPVSRVAMAKILNNTYVFKEMTLHKKRGTLDVSKFVAVGNHFELTNLTTGNQPKISSLPTSVISGQPIELTAYQSDYFEGSPLFFYWCADNGGMESLATNHRKIKFIAPTVTTPTEVNVYVLIGTANGKTDELQHTLTVYPAGGVDIAPTSQSTNLTFANVTQTSMTLNWTRGNGSGCLVIGRENGTVMSAIPDNGITYAPAPNFADGQAILWRPVYVGSDNSVNITGLKANTDYTFAIFEYNGSGTTIKYITTNPANGVQRTPDVLKNSSLTVTIMPEGAQNYGRWYISGGDGTLKKSGESISGLPSGTYKISLYDINTITGYTIGDLPTVNLMTSDSKSVFAYYNEGTNPLQVDFSWSPTQIVAGVPVTFTGTYSTEMLWTFEGANYSSYNWLTASNVIFAKEGVYNVTYKITDVNIGRSSTITKKIEVLNSNVVYPELTPVIKPRFGTLALANEYFYLEKYVKNLGATHNFGAQEIQYKVYFSDNNVLESWDTELEFNYTYSPLTINSNESYLLSDYQLRLPNTSVGVKYLIMKLETMYPSLNDPYHPEYWTDRDMTNNIFVLPITVSNNWIGKPNVAFTNNTGTYVNVSADLVVRNNPRPTFRVELSNKNGEFTNPLKIDDAWIDGNNYGVTKQNDIYLPANLEYGSNYKIRLVCVEDGSISPSSDPFSINGTPVVTIKDLNEAYTAGQPNFLLDINTSGLVNGIASQGTFYVNNTLLNTTNTVNGVYTLDFSKNATYTVRFDYVQNGKTYSVSKTVNVTGSYDIIVSGVPTSPICAGGSFNLSYTAQGTYKSDNNFTVELSDANGNFTNPLVINVIQSAVSGTITCAVPVTLAQCLKLQSICQWRCGYFDIDI